MIDSNDNEKTKLEVSEIWKFAAAIGISCAVSFGGHWLSDSSRYTTEADVEKIVSAKNAVTQAEMKHQAASLDELKRVVENNNQVLGDIRTEIAAMREERKLWLQTIRNVKDTD